MNLKLFIIVAILLTAFGNTHAVEPIAVEWVQKGGEVVPPSTLKEGTGRLNEVEQWTSLLRAGLDVERQDLNADGHLDALAEMAHARGATGNRVYLAFIQAAGRFRYVGETSRIARSLTYVESRRTYIVQVWDNGPGVDVSLWHLRNTGLTKVGRSLVLQAGDSGPAKDQELFRDVTVRVMPENRLLAVFAPASPEGRDFIDPADVAAAWNNPNGWSAADVVLPKLKSDTAMRQCLTGADYVTGIFECHPPSLDSRREGAPGPSSSTRRDLGRESC